MPNKMCEPKILGSLFYTIGKPNNIMKRMWMLVF